MRYLMRELVDIENPSLDINHLKGWEKIKTAFRFSMTKTVMYKKMQEKSEGEFLKRQMDRKEELKNILLYNFNLQLNKKSSSRIDYIKLSIPRQFEDILDDTISSVDFLSYTISRIKENKDFLLSFPDMPIMLKVSKRT